MFSVRTAIKCMQCGKDFQALKASIAIGKKEGSNLGRFCSLSCSAIYQLPNMKKAQIVECLGCGKRFSKKAGQIKKSPRHFCSHSCSCRYQNTHKVRGTRVSRLEEWIQSILVKEYPGLEFHFNRKDAIDSELDIYIPSLKLAFELNGIYHYEPIHGQNKLDQIRNNDHRKFQACIDAGISLCIIDTSSLKRFRTVNGQEYLDIITGIINDVRRHGIEP